MRSRTSASWPCSRSSSQRCGGAPVLPDERAVQRLAGRGIPDAHGLALVGDADRVQLARRPRRRAPRRRRPASRPRSRPRRARPSPAAGSAARTRGSRARRAPPSSSKTRHVVPVVPWSMARITAAGSSNRRRTLLGEPGCPSRPAAGLPPAGDSGSSHRRLPARGSCVRRRDRRHPAPSVRSGYGRGTAPNYRPRGTRLAREIPYRRDNSVNTKSLSWRARWTKSAPVAARSPGGPGRARPRRRGSPARAASTVIPISIPNRGANGTTTGSTSPRMRALAGDRRVELEPREAAGSPQRAIADREAEAAADARGEDGDGEVALAAAHRGDQRGRAARARLAQVAVAQDEHRRLRRQRAATGRAAPPASFAPPLPIVARRVTTSAPAAAARAAACRRVDAVVGHEHARVREAPRRSARERLLGMPVALVVRGDDHDDGGDVHGARLSCQPASPDPYSRRQRVPDVEAHITGTVWKIECEVGDDDRTRATPS